MSRFAAAPLRCEYCGDVIGVYEPFVVRADLEVRETSLAAEPDLPLAGGEHYHSSCYAARHEGTPGVA